jgi:hypothetical protein
VFPQCAAAGDQSPVILVERKAEERMERLTGRSRRQQIAVRIADAVTSILPVMEANVQWDPAISHRMERVELSRRRLSERDIKTPRRVTIPFVSKTEKCSYRIARYRAARS